MKFVSRIGLLSVMLAGSGAGAATVQVPGNVAAASMDTKIGGGSYSDADGLVYNIWAPGSISNAFKFNSTGTYTFTIAAKGTPAAGIWPNMQVSLDGAILKNYSVNKKSLANYVFTASVSGGTHTLKIAYTNDGKSGSEDRNLIVTKVTVQGPSGSATPAPTPKPSNPSTPAPSPTPSRDPASTGFSLGQVPFSKSSSFNTPVPSTAKFTRLNWPAATGWNYTVNWDHYSPAVYRSSSSDPMVAISVPASWGWAGGTINVRIPRGVSGAVGTDGELVVIDGTKVYSFWRFRRFNDTQASAESHANTDVVTGTGWGTKSPFRGAGITAAGASVFAGLLVQAETDKGEINHALHLALDAALIRPGAVGEAISSDGGSYSGISQEGDRFAIPPGVAMPSGLSPLGQKVFRAMQKYGAFNIDKAGGTTVLRAQANAFNAATMDALRKDLNKIVPLLQRVSY